MSSFEFAPVLSKNGFHVVAYHWEKKIGVKDKGSFILIAEDAFNKLDVTIEATIDDPTFDIDEFFEYVDFFLIPLGWRRDRVLFENNYQYSHKLFSTGQELDTTLKQTILRIEQIKNDLFDNSIEEI